MDVSLGSILLIGLSPMMLLVALLIKIDSTGPVLFAQRRYGRAGKPFVVLKFRTMQNHLRDPLGARQSFGADERVTRVGRWLRLTGLDEMPQLWNVLRGEMSLVGPRPHPVGMLVEGRPARDLVPWYFLRYCVKPGVTGFAQVKGLNGALRTREDLQHRIKYDLWYVRNRTFLLDLMILMGTFSYMLAGVVGALTRVDPARRALRPMQAVSAQSAAVPPRSDLR